jgi:hypothetical protein
MAKTMDAFITLDELRGERSDLWEEFQNGIERYRKTLWYKCSPGSVDRVGFPIADARRLEEVSDVVLAETGKTFRAPRLPPYKDGASFF